MLKPYQIDEQDVQYSSLTKKDIGKWCIILNGTYQGFWNTEEEAEKCILQLTTSTTPKE